LEYFTAISAAAVVRALPFKVGVVLMELLAVFVYVFDFRHRRRVKEHLLYAGVAKDDREAAVIARRNFFQLARIPVESLKITPRLDESNVGDYIKISGSKKAEELFFNLGKPSRAIIVTAHYGNWELAGVGYSLLSGMPMTTVMRPFDNPKLGARVSRIRVGHNHSTCPREGALKSLYQALKKGSSICIISDQHASRDEGVETVFMGRECRTHASPAILHLRTGVPILVAVSKRVGDGKFEFVCADPIEMKPSSDSEGDVERVAQRYTDALESLILADPTQWLWAHRRWLDMRPKSPRGKRRSDISSTVSPRKDD
jgi:KDO2-lipid IV(A) lauroyltransferase